MSCKSGHKVVATSMQLATGFPDDCVGTVEVLNCENCGCFTTRDGQCMNRDCSFSSGFNIVENSLDDYAIYQVNRTNMGERTHLTPNEKKAILTNRVSSKLRKQLAAMRRKEMLNYFTLDVLPKKDYPAAIAIYLDGADKTATKNLAECLSITSFGDGSRESLLSEVLSWPPEKSGYAYAYAISLQENLSSVDWQKTMPQLEQALVKSYPYGHNAILTQLSKHVSDIPDDVAQKLVPHIAMSNLGEDTVETYMSHLVMQKPENQELLASSPRAAVRRGVSRADITTDTILRQMANDIDDKVRETAIRRLIWRRNDPRINKAVEALASKGISEYETVNILSQRNSVWRKTPRCESCGRWVKREAPFCSNSKCNNNTYYVADDEQWAATPSPLNSELGSLLYANHYMVRVTQKGPISPADISVRYNAMLQPERISQEWEDFIYNKSAEWVKLRESTQRGMKVDSVDLGPAKLSFDQTSGVFELEYKASGMVVPVPATRKVEAMRKAIGMMVARKEIPPSPEFTRNFARQIPEMIPAAVNSSAGKHMLAGQPKRGWKKDEDTKVFYSGKNSASVLADNQVRWQSVDGKLAATFHSSGQQNWNDIGQQHTWTAPVSTLKARMKEMKPFSSTNTSMNGAAYRMLTALPSDDPFIQDIKTAAGIELNTSNGVWAATTGQVLMLVAADEGAPVPYATVVDSQMLGLIDNKAQVIVGQGHLAWEDPKTAVKGEVGVVDEPHYFPFCDVFQSMPKQTNRNVLSPSATINIGELEDKRQATVRLYGRDGVLYAEGVSEGKTIPQQVIGTTGTAANFDGCVVDARQLNSMLEFAAKRKTETVISITDYDFGDSSTLYPVHIAASDGSFIGAMMPYQPR